MRLKLKVDMTEKNHFQVLGIPSTTTERQIKDAYRALAKKFHPDVNPGNPVASEQFKEIAHAYWILSDPERKNAYLKTEVFSENATPRKRPNTSQRDPSSSQPRVQKSREGKDIIVRMSLTLEELGEGVLTKVKFRRKESCNSCEGTGISGGATSTLCPACHDKGEVPDLIHNEARRTGSLMTCRKCGGSGLQPMKACPQCHGCGQTQHDVAINVGIPPGSTAEERIVVKGQGHEGNLGKKSGNLCVIINQKPHPYLERQGDDLSYECKITFLQWLEGGELKIPTLNGPVSLTLAERGAPEGTLKVGGKGMPKKNGDLGDLIVKYRLCVPSNLTRRQRSLLKKLETTEGFNLHHDERGFLCRSIDD